MLQTHSLQFSYNPQNTFSFPDIRLNAGENLLILGDSGIGKTTLLHLLAGLLKAQSGEIKIADVEFSKLSSKDADRFRGQNIGLVFQKPHFMSSLNLLENLLLVQKLAGKKADKALCLSRLGKVGLEGKASQKTQSLSQGERQRASIAMATINQPQLILADEPTASLDDGNCQKVLDLLLTQAQETQSNLIIITHDARVKPYFSHIISLT